MNTSSKLSVKASALVVAALSALSMQAHASDYATYERVVLGRSELVSQAVTQASPSAPKLVPGSYARYLIRSNGMTEAQALAQARAAGEEPTWQAAQPAREVALTGIELHERAMGRSVLRKTSSDVQATMAD